MLKLSYSKKDLSQYKFKQPWQPISDTEFIDNNYCCTIIEVKSGVGNSIGTTHNYWPPFIGQILQKDNCNLTLYRKINRNAPHFKAFGVNLFDIVTHITLAQLETSPSDLFVIFLVIPSKSW